MSPQLTANKKSRALEELTTSVNAVSKSGQRTSIQVKKKISDLKVDVKKKAADIRRHRQATGGGGPPDQTLGTAEELLLSTINPQLFEGIIDEGDTSAEPVILVGSSPESSNGSVVECSPATQEMAPVEMPIPQPSIGLEAKALIQLTNSAKKRKVCASSAAEDILEIERQKLEMTKQLMAIRRIELSARLKSYQYAGIDVDEEIKELQDLC